MFQSARIKLTVWYLLAIMTISGLFSIAIYKMVSRELDRFEQLHRVRIQRRMTQLNQIAPDPELTEEIRGRIIIILVFINGGILMTAGGFGYMLAGQTLKPIQNMMEDQNRFVSDASHELRTPLTSLKTAMEVYLRGQKPTVAEAKELVKESIFEVDRLQSLAESLLQLAQYQNPDEKIQFGEIDIKPVILQAVQRMKPLAQNKQIKIDIEGVKNHSLSGDHDNLVKVIAILLDNAIKYSPEKTAINLTTEQKDKCVLLKVKDEGMGIEAKDIPHIFKRLYQADKARCKGTANGYGLGLAIAKKIIEIHRGTINVKSQTDKGTEFIIKLPQKIS